VKALALYDSPDLREVTGPTLRPGGFALTDRAVALCRLKAGAIALDVGCGLGATVNRLASEHQIRAFGMDTAASLFREERVAKGQGTLAAALANRLPFGKEEVDAVFCECVLSLLQDPASALEEFHRVLTSDGWLVITDIYARGRQVTPMLNQLPVISCLKGARPKEDMVALTEAAGFQTVLWEDHTLLLKQLAAKIVFAYGSMQGFWSHFVPECSVSGLTCGLEQARPGYCLMMARKMMNGQCEALPGGRSNE